jgi:hypothetical protein
MAFSSCGDFEVCIAQTVHVHLDRRTWRQHKDGFVRVIPSVLHNGIAVARVASSSLLSNTCCTSLLLQGAAVSASACPP